MRASGILMHISSLPGPNGIGAMGAEAYRFVDFLKQGGQRYWQLLPMNPTGYGDSPYQSFSTFAGNHYFIDLETLVNEGLLRREEVDSVHWGDRQERVDFGILSRERLKVLYLAYERFIGVPNRAFQSFLQEQREWLADYALFMALKDHFPGADWQSWPEDLRLRDPKTLQEYREKLKYQIVFQYFLQYKFAEQWSRLRAYAQKQGIRLIGDVPIYVPLDSVDVWTNPQLFQLDDQRRPTKVAGVPPDGFSADGQLWGNPLYDWQAMKQDGYGWWLRRLSKAAQMYDMVRLDHFRGFASYWAVPAGEETARNGQWLQGPGMDFVHAVEKALPKLSIIAEDLGCLTEDVARLLEDSGYPGMKVLDFAFDSQEPSAYLPHRYTPNCVCYTGTHDNMTLKQWLDESSPETIAYAKAYMGLNQEEGLCWGVIRSGMSSVAELFVTQMQDILELGGEARMNFPGTLSADNWTWRVRSDCLTETLARRLYTMTRYYGRLA